MEDKYSLELAIKVEDDRVITDADCSIYAKSIVIATGLELDRIIKSKDYFTVGFTGRYLKSMKFRDSNILVYPAPNKDLPFLGVHTCHQDTLVEYYSITKHLCGQQASGRNMNFILDTQQA